MEADPVEATSRSDVGVGSAAVVGVVGVVVGADVPLGASLQRAGLVLPFASSSVAVKRS